MQVWIQINFGLFSMKLATKATSDIEVNIIIGVLG